MQTTLLFASASAEFDHIVARLDSTAPLTPAAAPPPPSSREAIVMPWLAAWARLAEEQDILATCEPTTPSLTAGAVSATTTGTMLSNGASGGGNSSSSTYHSMPPSSSSTPGLKRKRALALAPAPALPPPGAAADPMPPPGRMCNRSGSAAAAAAPSPPSNAGTLPPSVTTTQAPDPLLPMPSWLLMDWDNLLSDDDLLRLDSGDLSAPVGSVLAGALVCTPDSPF